MHNRRLIEETFPLKEVSEHSKHEKNVRHGHISTLHIWPARRPLAACRAAIIAALMPDPGDEAERQKLNRKIASITKWKTENGAALDYFREEIRKEYGGRPPRVLDMFAGGGAIPLEAMRLGCDVTAIDYNPVAWFILKCTLEFPQRLAGERWPLPKARSKKYSQTGQLSLGLAEPSGRQGGLAEHVHYWGNWVLRQARDELALYYPTIDGQPTAAYLWARTVPCPDPKCGTIVPLLKTLWLSKKAEKALPDTPENRARADYLRIKTTKNVSKVIINGRRALRLIAPKKGEGGPVLYQIWTPGSKDKVPNGTMVGARTTCPCCGINIAKDYIKGCGHIGKISEQMTSVVIQTDWGKDFRAPIPIELEAVESAARDLQTAADKIPYGLPIEPLPGPEILGFRVPLYGFKTWADLFIDRQLLGLCVLVKWTRSVRKEMASFTYPEDWIEAVLGFLTLSVDRLLDFANTNAQFKLGAETVNHSFVRFAIPMTWDFAEANIIGDSAGSYYLCFNRIVTALQSFPDSLFASTNRPQVMQGDAKEIDIQGVDVIVTDPPYYDSIPYADLSDFFYVWLRRILGDQYPDHFGSRLVPKSDELVQQSRSGRLDKTGYEAGMIEAFRRGYDSLAADGRIVIVFAHKDPDAWETLTTALIESGFVVTASWPVDTEQGSRMRAIGSAALASSIWLVCQKRAKNIGTGRYRAVRKAMEERVTQRLQYFWDIGLSGPDFVWAAIGPALESYSTYDEVKRLDGSPFTVSDFLKDVRRMVADFALGQILKGHSTEGLDEWTRYYLMHRSSFGLEAAAVGECILLAQGYGLDLNELRSPRGFVASAKRIREGDDEAEQKASGSNVQLAKWDERTRNDLGEPHPSGGLPMIDMLHRLMRLWSAGNLDALKSYAAEKGLRQNDLFWAVAQAILEMAPAQSRERTLLEALVAWGRGKTAPAAEKLELPLVFAEGDS